MKDSYNLKTPVPEQKTYVIITSLNYVHFMGITVDDVNFCDGLEYVYVK